MPYQRKFDREKAKWFTLADAVLHVMAAEGFHSPSTVQIESVAEDKNEPLAFPFMLFDLLPKGAPEDNALAQIRQALHDGEIPIRWLQEAWPIGSSFHPNTIFDPDLPTPSGPFWLHAEIFPSEDYAVNDADRSLFFAGLEREWVGRRLRRLLLFRERVVELWPVRKDKLPPADKPRLTTQQAMEVVRNAARQLYVSERPNILEAERRIRELVPGTGRKVLRAVLKEDEFARLRKPAGNSSTRSKR